jgi:hypothetical protein
MPEGHRAPAVFVLIACALVALFLAQSFLASRVKSPTFDEATHIAAGLSYVRTGEVRANPQHPPLLKTIAGLSLLLAGMRLPDIPETRRMLGGAGGENAVGRAVISRNGPDRVMFWARLPFPLLAAMLGLLIYFWVRKLAGDVAALAALFLYALDPTILAHSYLVTMDVGLALFAVLFLFALWEYLQFPSSRRLLFCGLAMGALLAAKFSAVFLLPVAAALLLAAVRWPTQPVPDDRSQLLCPYSRSSADASAVRGYAAAACAFLAICLMATLVIQALYFSPGGLFLYSTGIQRVNVDHAPDYPVFLAGRLQHNFTGYFAAAYLLKEPVASLLLVAIGLVALARSKTISVLAKLFLLLPPAVLFAAHTIWADNMGIRYMIPELPFACCLGGMGAAWLIQSRSRWTRLLAVVLAVWIVVAAIGIYPDHLSYFNEAACLPGHLNRIGIDGGARCGPLWLDDSNVDWGQGLKQLKGWLDRHARGRAIRLAYFGTFLPEAYGVACERIGPEELMEDPQPGLYAVSAHFVARVPALGARLKPGAGEWLRRTPPVAIVGHAFYVYEIGVKTTARRMGRRMASRLTF